MVPPTRERTRPESLVTDPNYGSKLTNESLEFRGISVAISTQLIWPAQLECEHTTLWGCTNFPNS